MQFNLQDQLGYNINRVALLFRRDLIKQFRSYNITPEQWQTLAALWQNKILSQTEIASITLQDNPSVSRMIKRMIQNNLVIKRRDKKSERVTLIELTKKGKDLANILPKILLKSRTESTNCFSDAKRKKLLSLLMEYRKCVNDLPS